MQTIDAIYNINGSQAVPIRLVPYVTGGDISAYGIAQFLSDANHGIYAYVCTQAANVNPSRMFAKEWNAIVHAIASLPKQLQSGLTLESMTYLPPSTYITLDDLQGVFEDYYLPPREDMTSYTELERENFQLFGSVIVPDALVAVVLEGFERPSAQADASSQSQAMPRARAQDTEMLHAIREAGYAPQALPKNEPGKPGVKAEIRKRLGSKGVWTGTTVFDKAWERLRKQNDIVDGD